MSWSSNRKHSALADLAVTGAVSTAEAVADRASDAAATASDRIVDLVDEVAEDTARRTVLSVVVLLALIAIGVIAWRRRSTSVEDATPVPTSTASSRAAA